MKTRIMTMAAVLGCALILAAGCAKNGFTPKGGLVSVGATSGGARTRTVYGDDFTSGSTQYQQISWETGDVLRVVSERAGVYNNLSNLHYADYTVTTVTTQDDQTSAAVVNTNPNGLCWEDGYTGAYDFYAVFPSPETAGSTTSIVAPDADGNLADGAVTGTVTATIPAAPALAGEATKKYLTATGAATTAEADDLRYTYDVYAPDMTQAVMTAAATEVKESDAKPQVSLHFKPAFTAFEINLTSGDEDFTLNSIALSATGEDEYLAGTFSMLAGSDVATASNVKVATDGASKSVTLTAPESGIALTEANGATFTLFTLPVTNTGALKLTVVTTAGTAHLTLTGTDKTSAYQFQAGQKYRINLLKLGGQWKYKITIDPDALPWDLVEEETTFSQNISSTSFNITGATETGNNYYPVGTKDYQVRTLDMSKSDPYFEVTFTPRAPVGGYWMLTPVSNAGLGTAAFNIYVWDEDEDTGSKDLKGQIMYQPVTLRIYPNVTDDQRTEDHAIIFHSYFSGSQDFDPASTYSADSEIQDIHTDGSFSFWRFVIPAKTN